MSGAFDRPLERAARLLAGLVLFGLAMALLLESRMRAWTRGTSSTRASRATSTSRSARSR